MKKTLIYFIFIVSSLFIFAACGGSGSEYDDTPAEGDYYEYDGIIFTDIKFGPTILTVERIPDDMGPAQFLNDSDFNEFDYSGEENPAWAVFRVFEPTTITLWHVNFHYDTDLVRHYHAYWARGSFTASADQPLAAAFWRETPGMGIFGIETQGRFFKLIENTNGSLVLHEFLNMPPAMYEPLVTIFQATDEVELVITWITNAEHSYISEDVLQDSEWEWESWLKFSTNTPVSEFNFFSLEHDFTDEEWLFVPNETVLRQDVLAPGTPLVLPWIPMGTLPTHGFSFFTEGGELLEFWLNSNNSNIGFPLLFGKIER